jgi:cytidine deaminase
VTPWAKLFEVAEAARLRAYAPYSKFNVGVAVLATDGTLFPGCNVENASYGLAMCAERNAVGRLVVEGKQLAAVAIVVDSDVPTPPCGMCRQVMSEMGAPAMEIRSRNLAGDEASWTMAELLPHAFTKAFL